MNHGKKKAARIIHQELALDDYLKTMLEEIPDDSVYDVEPVIAEQQESTTKVVPETTVMQQELTVQNSLVEINRQLQVVHQKTATVQARQALSIMPEWAQREFQALLFKVDKLILAAPLTDLLRTIRIVRNPTRIPEQPSWFMGLLDEHDTRIGVLDTGQLVYGKARGGQRNLEEKPFSSILITQDGRWGLACDEVLSIARFTPDKVRWRTRREKRSWLVGTVIDELTAVIDIQQLVPHRKQ
jgi:purine-binding chemotaxis protein CheW